MTQVEEAKQLMTKLIAKNKELSNEITKLKEAAKALEADSEAFAKLKEEHEKLNKANKQLFEENEILKKTVETNEALDNQLRAARQTIAHYQEMEEELNDMCRDIKESLSESDAALA